MVDLVARAALLSTALISVLPNVLLLLFPGAANDQEGLAEWLSLGQAVSAGGLLGDVFLHSLSHESSPDRGVWILTGYTLFLFMDMAIRSIESHSPGKAGAALSVRARSAATLNLVADMLHNFTDGLAVGVSYAILPSENQSMSSLLFSRGGLASFSVLLHEIPHEIGDYCTLLRAGYTKGQAVAMQFTTAAAAFAGCTFALGVSGATHANERLLNFTSGGFIYLASTTLLPGVLETDSSLRLRCLQFGCFVTGLACLYAVSMFESHEDHSSINHRHHHHHDYSEL